jgi:hypothetical protein
LAFASSYLAALGLRVIAIRSGTQRSDVQLVHHLPMILLRSHLRRRGGVLPAGRENGKRRDDHPTKQPIFHKVIVIGCTCLHRSRPPIIRL